MAFERNQVNQVFRSKLLLVSIRLIEKRMSSKQGTMSLFILNFI